MVQKKAATESTKYTGRWAIFWGMHFPLFYLLNFLLTVAVLSRTFFALGFENGQPNFPLC